jgi:hypothetical protein
MKVGCYSDGRNSVVEAKEIPFEISQALPQTLTIYGQINLEWVRDKVKRNPLDERHTKMPTQVG